MRTGSILGAVTGVAVAAFLVLPATTGAYSLLGHDLPLSERHFRVFNNFEDATANDNTVADPQFPGYVGAELALWKAYVEWGSRLHGNGDGDPHQPFGLGSGGANFDPSWQGNAASVGDINDNICSALAGSSGGVIGYTETTMGPGWRMRFYDAWVWDDGPGTQIGSRYDLQGVGTLLFGFALGLGHSADNNATMNPAVANGNVSKRSIEADDIAGIQAIYGVAAASKPVITGVTVTATDVTVQGSQFAPTGNELWLTRRTVGGNGTPIKVLNLPSDGFTIVAPMPPDALPGDVLVKVPGTGFATLSNAFPAPLPACPAPTRTCQTSPNSVDPVGAIMGSTGSASVFYNDLVLVCSGCPAGTSGRFFFGANPTQVPFGNGYRCVAGPVFRFGVVVTNSFGEAILPVDLTAAPAAGNIAQGDTRYFQYWYRNPAAGGAGFNLSDALRVVFCP